MMKKIISLLSIMIIVGSISWFPRSFTKSMNTIDSIHSPEDVSALFPQTVSELTQKADSACAIAKKDLQAIIDIKADQRTFSNTFRALDLVYSQFLVVACTIEAIKMMSDKQEMRDVAEKTQNDLNNFIVDYFSHPDIYRACNEYVTKRDTEVLTAEDNYFIEEIMRGFRYAGLHLPVERYEKIKALNKQLTPLGNAFDTNINNDHRFITVSRAELAGMDDAFVNALPKTDDGLYKVSTDYPVYVPIMGNCTVESTRHALWRQFANRAYPQNSILLKQIIDLRDELAKELDFASYAHFNLDDKMAKNPETADLFLNELIVKSKPKVKQEIELLVTSLPEGVRLTDDGKMLPWDVSFIKESYKKKHLDVNERKIAEYFPLEHTLEQLFSIYEQFMGITFKPVTVNNLWHKEVITTAVYDEHGSQLLGYLLLDLFPREAKYTHACEISIVKARKTDSERYPAVAIVLANFTPPTTEQPSLLQRNEVQTFFHEMGHALHEILGATHFSLLSGTNVKRDFVEMPSQMLEEWLWDKDILKKVSKHYQTGESLPDDLIERIRALKTFDAGDFVQRQAFLAKLSLYYFKARVKKSLYDIHQELHHEVRTHVAWEPEDHFEASFGHLIGYGAGYYGYLWSKVYALDLARPIRKAGFMNRAIGARYVEEILSKGGSVDPEILLKNFLGRAPTSDAFFIDMGISS